MRDRAGQVAELGLRALGPALAREARREPTEISDWRWFQPMPIGSILSGSTKERMRLRW